MIAQSPEQEENGIRASSPFLNGNIVPPKGLYCQTEQMRHLFFSQDNTWKGSQTHAQTCMPTHMCVCMHMHTHTHIWQKNDLISLQNSTKEITSVEQRRSSVLNGGAEVDIKCHNIDLSTKDISKRSKLAMKFFHVS